MLRGFNHAVGVELRGLFGNARRAFRAKGKFPEWVTGDLRKELVVYWDSEEFKKRSETNRKNRLTEQVLGEGPTTHNTGRHSFFKKKKMLVYFFIFLI